MSSDAEGLAKVIADHRRADWSDRTYACAGCRQRAEAVPVPAGETEEQVRERWEKHQKVIKPDWSFADYNAHLAEQILASDWFSDQLADSFREGIWAAES